MRGYRILTCAAGAGVLGLGLLGSPTFGADSPAEAVENLENAGKLLFKMADINNDNRISQQEATDAGNLIVGGFFFRADANGDGKVTKEEAQAARENLFNQRPLFRFVFQRAESEVKEQAAQTNQQAPNLMALLDGNHDGEFSAPELRQAVMSGVQTLFLTADVNKDNQLEPAEFNQAVIEFGKTAVQTAFTQADRDNNGAVSQAEFDQAIIKPAHIAFSILDANKDNQLSAEELRNGARIFIRELQGLQVPEAPNSLSNRLEQSSASTSSTTIHADAPATPTRVTPAAGQAAGERVPQEH